MAVKFNVSYITTLPKEANAPRVTIKDGDGDYVIKFWESDGVLTTNRTLVDEKICGSNETVISGNRQWYTKWDIEVYNSKGELVFYDLYNPNDKVVFIKIDSYALGDTIAWIPYIRLFKRMHHCHVICSTFHNDILVNDYPDIMFVKPNTVIDNVYSQYYVGAAYDNNLKYCRVNASDVPLQMVASDTLGLDPIEIKPTINIDSFNRFGGKYVTLSEFGSASKKNWGYPNGWQIVVDFLKSNGIEVVVISKEKTYLQGVIDLSGDYPLIDRMRDIKSASLHMGVSSGLSWLSWALGTKVMMVSDVTPNSHEFSYNIIRLGDDNLKRVDYDNDYITQPETVIKNLKNVFML